VYSLRPAREKEINMKVGTAINIHKALVTPVVLGLMWFFNNWSTEAFIYLAIHGSYSILWLIKDSLYPDKRFDEKMPAAIAILFVFLPLAGYYIAPYLLISRHLTLPSPLIGLVIVLYIFGIFLHYVSDAQKFYTLQNKKGLIEDGLFKFTRNPNYLGEIMIYAAYATMSMHWLPFLVLSAWVFGFFVRNMFSKDESLSRYPQFAEYKQKSGLIFPKIF
jgi:protein-S-isoprenylcysteine O-methyltransferase Ste14